MNLNPTPINRPFVVRHTLTGEDIEFDSSSYSVHFPVTPPTLTTPEGERVTVRDAEGVIIVKAEDCGLSVRGYHGITIEPEGSSSMLIRLRDAEDA